MKSIYLFAGVTVWMVGVIFFTHAMYVGPWHTDGLKLVTMGAFAVAAFVAIFSFLYGAQPGHYIRFVMICLLAFLCFLTDLNERQLFSGGEYRAALLAVVVAMIVLSSAWKKRFHEEYRQHGRVNYFDKYFGK